jgi:hypothetical protein
VVKTKGKQAMIDDNEPAGLELLDPTLPDDKLAEQMVDELLHMFRDDRDIFSFWVYRLTKDVPMMPLDYPDEDERHWLIAHLLGGYGIVALGRTTQIDLGTLAEARENARAWDAATPEERAAFVARFSAEWDAQFGTKQ